MRISLVVAAARNRVIGFRGEIPWRLPDDQRFFRRVTMGHAILMGRKTFDSIGKPLPGRRNLVLSRNAAASTPGVRHFRDLETAVDWARQAAEAELFVIGGEALYRDGMEHADRIFRTHVEAEPQGDVFFPEIDPRIWHCVRREPHAADERHAHEFSIETWERRA